MPPASERRRCDERRGPKEQARGTGVGTSRVAWGYLLIPESKFRASGCSRRHASEALTPLAPLSQRERGEDGSELLPFSLLSLWERRGGVVRARGHEGA